MIPPVPHAWTLWLVLPAVLVATSLGPGLLLVRRFRWNPLEKLCVAVAASLLLTYLFSLARFVFHLPLWMHAAFTVACGACLIASWPTLRRLLRARRVRRTLLAYLLLLAWVLALLGLTRHYSGSLTSSDWHVHYDKAVFFLSSSVSDPSAAGILLDRPPAANLIWSHVMAHVGTRFDVFQVTCAFFATLALLPCCLLAPALLGPRRKRRARGRPDPLLIAALLALSPLFVQNVTYTWTKVPSTSCSVLGIALYLSGMRKRDPLRLALAFATLAFGCLVHFTAVPFALFVTLHYLWRGRWTNGRWWRQAAIIGVCGAVVLATWHCWAFVRFGAAANAAGNPGVRAASKGSVEDNVARVCYNAVSTVVPYYVRPIGPLFTQRSTLGWVRDHAFLGYSANLLLAVGSLAGLLVAGVLWRDLAPMRRSSMSPACILGAVAVVLALMYVPPARNVLVHALPTVWLLAVGMVALALALASLCRNVHGRAAFSPEQRFWRGLLACALVVSAAGHPSSVVGVAHICMQPLVYIGVTLLAVNLPAMPGWFRFLAVVGMTIDFLLGILLHFHMQHQTFEPGHDPGLVKQAELNWLEKQAAGFTFLGDHFPAAAPVILALLVFGAAAMVWYTIRATRLARNRDHGSIVR